MAEIFNLNRFRKAKDKAARADKAQENRIVHGRTKAEKDLAKAREAKARQDLEAHRLRDGDQ